MLSEKVGCWQKKINDNQFALNANHCELHQLLEDHYCSDCNQTACVECVTDVHALHQCDQVCTVLSESLTQLWRSVQPACEFASRADALLKRLEQDHESIESNRSICKDSISALFSQIRTTLNEREQTLLSGLDDYIDTKLDEVERLRSSICEIQKQLHHSTEVVSTILESIKVNASLLTDKYHLLDDLHFQEQSIFEMEEDLLEYKFSSKYIGFQDNSTSLLKEIDQLFTMCEYYPDGESGYYTSRVLLLASEDTTSVKQSSEIPRSFSLISRETSPDKNNSNGYIRNETELERSNVIREHPNHIESALLHRSMSTPASYLNKHVRNMKKRPSDASAVQYPGPLIPIQFNSCDIFTPILKPLHVFDKLSSTKGERVRPHGVCTNKTGSIIVTDENNHCLRIISSSGKFLGSVGKQGKGPGEFEEPCAVTIDKNEHIIVCQRKNSRLQKLTSAGKCVKKFGYKSLRNQGIGELCDFSVANKGLVYVTDKEKGCIHVFRNDGDHRLTNSLCHQEIKSPAGIAINCEGHLIVADRESHCLWVLESNGAILQRIGNEGCGPGELCKPYSVAVHPNGSIIVSESGNHRISVFSPGGKFLQNFGQRGSEPGMFAYPRHVCVTPKGEIIVADEFNYRLQLFELKENCL